MIIIKFVTRLNKHQNTAKNSQATKKHKKITFFKETLIRNHYTIAFQNKGTYGMAQNYNKQDSLLASLIEVCNLLHCPQSPHTLTAGLPLIENRLTPNLFIRACERAGLTSSLVNRPLEEIPESVLPCVLLLQDQQAVVLKDIDYDPQGSAIAFNIYDPSKSTSDPLQTVEANELKALYQGQCLYIKQSYSPSDDKASQEDTKHWLKNTLKFSKKHLSRCHHRKFDD